MSTTDNQQKADEFRVDEKYERLLKQRETDPEAFRARRISERITLEYYEKQKAQAQKGATK